MKSLLSFFVKTLPFTLGVIFVLTSLAFLVELESEDFWAFVFFAIIGIPMLLYGINKVSNKE
jgi:hypothetical protein